MLVRYFCISKRPTGPIHERELTCLSLIKRYTD